VIRNLSIIDIGAWQLKKLPTRADRPALQRGAVWEHSQVEALWDSLVRGLPIGSFLLVPHTDGERGGESLTSRPVDQTEVPPPAYYLLAARV
jgi:hypothetical protein